MAVLNCTKLVAGLHRCDRLGGAATLNQRVQGSSPCAPTKFTTISVVYGKLRDCWQITWASCPCHVHVHNRIVGPLPSALTATERPTTAVPAMPPAARAGRCAPPR